MLVEDRGMLPGERLIHDRVVCGRGRNPTLRSSTCSAGVEVENRDRGAAAAQQAVGAVRIR